MNSTGLVKCLFISATFVMLYSCEENNVALPDSSNSEVAIVEEDKITCDLEKIANYRGTSCCIEGMNCVKSQVRG